MHTYLYIFTYKCVYMYVCISKIILIYIYYSVSYTQLICNHVVNQKGRCDLGGQSKSILYSPFSDVQDFSLVTLKNTWLISCEYHDSFMHACAVTDLCVCRDSYTHVPCRICIMPLSVSPWTHMTHLCVCHDSRDAFMCVPWLTWHIRVCAMTHMTHSCVCHDTHDISVCVPWLTCIRPFLPLSPPSHA